MKPAERRSYANANIKRALHSEQVAHWVKVQDRIRRAVQARMRRARQNEGNQ